MHAPYIGVWPDDGHRLGELTLVNLTQTFIHAERVTLAGPCPRLRQRGRRGVGRLAGARVPSERKKRRLAGVRVGDYRRP